MSVRYTKVVVVTRSKARLATRYRASIRLSGFWLDTLGFEYGTLVRADYRQGSIVLKVQGKGIDAYNNVVKEVMDNRSGLFQVKHNTKRKRYYPTIDIAGFWLEELGFTIGSVAVVQCEHGVITLRLLDLEKLDFDK